MATFSFTVSENLQQAWAVEFFANTVKKNTDFLTVYGDSRLRSGELKGNMITENVCIYKKQ